MMSTHELDAKQSNTSAKILYRPFGIVASMWAHPWLVERWRRAEHEQERAR